MTQLNDEYEMVMTLRNKRTGQTSEIRYSTVWDFGMDHQPEYEESIFDAGPLYARLGPRVLKYDVDISFQTPGYTLTPDTEKRKEQVDNGRKP